MDRAKTGALIAQARKEQNMTQKELAERIHVSDRAVSKWERGAGFPDVTLLEPLAAALNLRVLDLLRGQRMEETDVHTAVQEAVRAMEEERRQDRKDICKSLLKLLAMILTVVLIGFWIFPVKTDVNETVTAGVYVDGALAAYTEVEIRGEISHYVLTGKRGYHGRFAIGCVEWTTREDARADFSLRGGGIAYSLYGDSTHAFYDPSTLICPNMTQFAFALQSPNHLVSGQKRAEHWCVLATSPEWYERYCVQVGNPPPPLTTETTAQLPEFYSAWSKIPQP